MFEAEEGLKRNCSVMLQRYLFKDLQLNLTGKKQRLRHVPCSLMSREYIKGQVPNKAAFVSKHFEFQTAGSFEMYGPQCGSQ